MALINCSQILFDYIGILHSYFVRKAALTSWVLRMRRPPSQFGLHIFSHAIVEILVLTPSPSLLLFQKKTLFVLSFYLKYLGILNNFIEHWGIFMRFDLIRTTSPAF